MTRLYASINWTEPLPAELAGVGWVPMLHQRKCIVEAEMHTPDWLTIASPELLRDRADIPERAMYVPDYEPYAKVKPWNGPAATKATLQLIDNCNAAWPRSRFGLWGWPGVRLDGKRVFEMDESPIGHEVYRHPGVSFLAPQCYANNVARALLIIDKTRELSDKPIFPVVTDIQGLEPMRIIGALREHPEVAGVIYWRVVHPQDMEADMPGVIDTVLALKEGMG